MKKSKPIITKKGYHIANIEDMSLDYVLEQVEERSGINHSDIVVSKKKIGGSKNAKKCK